MDESTPITADPREQIVRLEARIEQLAAKIDSCRKFILAARIALALGGMLFLAIVLGAVASDPTALTAAIVAVLGGFVLLGSNRSTANEAAAQMAAAEAERAELIGSIDLRTVGNRDDVH